MGRLAREERSVELGGLGGGMETGRRSLEGVCWAVGTYRGSS